MINKQFSYTKGEIIMMTGFLDGSVWILAALLGVILSGGKNKVSGSLIIVVCGVIGFLTGLWNYVPISFYYGFLWFAFIPFVAGFLSPLIGDSSYGDIFNKKGLGIFSIICVLFLILNLASISMFRASAVGNLITPKDVSEDFLNQIDTTKIRLVPKRPALALSKGSLSKKAVDGINLGSVVHLDTDHGTIQLVQDSMYWVIPLEYNGWRAQSQIGDIPGFVAASAYDTNIEAPLINKSPVTGKDIKVKASINGNFSRFAKRILWKKYPFSILADFSFEVDDNWMPHVVATVLKPAVGMASLVPSGVAVLDLTTLDSEKYAMDEIPVWIDRVQPLNVALDRINDYGKLRLGFAKSFLKDPRRFKATAYEGVSGNADDLFFVESGEKTFWFTGLTSVSDKDTSLIGAMFLDTRSGETFKMPASGVDEDGVIGAVRSALGNEALKWTPVQPILYNVLGINTWVVPIISIDKGYWQGVALVQMGNVNNLVWERNLKATLRSYLKKIKGSNAVDLDMVEAVYEGFLNVFNLVAVNGNINAVFSLQGHKKAFECSGDSIPECMVLPADQEISLTVNDTGEKVLNVVSVAGFTLDGNSDRKQIIEPQVQTNEIVEDIQDFDALTPADKAAALNALEKTKKE